MLKQRVVLKYDPSRKCGLSIQLEYNVNYQDAVVESKKRPLELKPGDVLFYAPDLSIPRFKLKSITEQLGVSATRDSEKADYIIINTYKKHVSMQNLSTQQVQFVHCQQLIDPAEHRNFISTIENESECYDQEFIELYRKYVSMGYEFIISSEDCNSVQKYHNNKTGKYHWYAYGLNEINILYLKSPKLLSKLRSQDSLTPLVNQDSIIVTDEKFKDLDRMLKSRDEDNVIIAMEIMANSNYDESILNNYLLLTSNIRRISELRESGHKNFKGFVEYYGLDIKHIRSNISNTDVDFIITFLKNKGKLTQESMNKVLAYYADTHHQFVGKYCNSILVPNNDVEYDD